MIGLLLALLWSGWQYLQGVPIEAFWSPVVNFLFQWYFAWAIFMGLVYLVLVILVSLGVGISGFEKFGPVGGALGAIGGGCGSILLFGLAFLAHYGALIAGTAILKGALVNGAWNIGSLVFGLILVAVGLYFSRSRGSSSSSKDD